MIYFSEEEIYKTTLFMLTESILVDLVPKIGERANFINQLEILKNPIDVNIQFYFCLLN